MKIDSECDISVIGGGADERYKGTPEPVCLVRI